MTDLEIVELALRRVESDVKHWDMRLANCFRAVADHIVDLAKRHKE